MSDTETNKRIVVDSYQTALSGNPEKAVDDHLGHRFVQPNPDAADGPESLSSMSIG
jgi:predicted SnoaL-like aldol condensation-catalyzing enzyme